MIAILILFLIAKFFYELAQEYYKHRWLYVILGILFYYLGTFIGSYVVSFIYGDYFELNLSTAFRSSSIVLLSGFIGAFLFYVYLSKKWKSEQINISKNEIDDIGKPQDDIDSTKLP